MPAPGSSAAPPRRAEAAPRALVRHLSGRSGRKSQGSKVGDFLVALERWHTPRSKNRLTPPHPPPQNPPPPKPPAVPVSGPKATSTLSPDENISLAGQLREPRRIPFLHVSATRCHGRTLRSSACHDLPQALQIRLARGLGSRCSIRRGLQGASSFFFLSVWFCAGMDCKTGKTALC